MGRIGLPSISKLEEVLDLIMDPEKYKKYLVEFKSIHDDAVMRLDMLKTKEDADKYFNEALDANTLAQQELHDVHATKAKAEQDIKTQYEILDATRAEFKKHEDEVCKSLDAQLVDFNRRDIEHTEWFAQAEQIIKTQQAKNEQVRTELDKLKLDLDEKAAKLKAAVIALA
jgi:vacuolar-type H+-ATPase subunit I/STV1